MGTVREWGREFDDAVLQPIKNTVEAIIEDPKKLAMVAISVFAPGVGTAIGTALGLPSAAATIVGNAVVNTALNGGDVKAAIISAAIPVVGKELAGAAASTFVDAGMDQALAQSAGNVVAGAGLAAAQGKDPLEALISGGLSAGTAAITRDLPGFSALPEAAQRSVNAAVAAELSGRDASQAAISAAMDAGLKSLRGLVNTPDTAPDTMFDNIDAGGGWNPADVPDTTPDNIDAGGGWNPADVTPYLPDFGVPTQEEQQPAIDELLKELAPYEPPPVEPPPVEPMPTEPEVPTVPTQEEQQPAIDDLLKELAPYEPPPTPDESPEMVITAPRPEDDADNIDAGGGWNPADVTPQVPEFELPTVPTQEEQQPSIDDLLKELEPYAPPVDEVPEMVITAPRPEDDPDNIDAGGGWNPADVPDTTPDNIDAGGGWNPADVPDTTTGGGSTTTPPKPTTPPAKPPTQPPAQQPSQPSAQPAGMDMLSLLGLMGLLGGQSAPAQPVQTLPADVKSFEELGYGDLFGPKLQFSEGGDIDALIQLLRG